MYVLLFPSILFFILLFIQVESLPSHVINLLETEFSKTFSMISLSKFTCWWTVLLANKWFRSAFFNADNVASFLGFAKFQICLWYGGGYWTCKLILQWMTWWSQFEWKEEWVPLSTTTFGWFVKIKSIYDEELESIWVGSRINCSRPCVEPTE